MLEILAIKTAKENPDENVVFGINQYSWARPLLQLDLEVKFEKLKLKHLTVFSYENLSELTDVNLCNASMNGYEPCNGREYFKSKRGPNPRSNKQYHCLPR